MELSYENFELAGYTVSYVGGLRTKYFLAERRNGGQNGAVLTALGVQQTHALLFDRKARYFTAPADIKYGFPEFKRAASIYAFVSALQSLEDLKRRNGWRP